MDVGINQLLESLVAAEEAFRSNGGDPAKPCRIVIQVVEADDLKDESDLKSGQAQIETNF